MASPTWISDTDTTFTVASSSWVANTPATTAGDRLLLTVATYQSRTVTSPSGYNAIITTDFMHVLEQPNCATAGSGTVTVPIVGGTDTGIVRVTLIRGSHGASATQGSTFTTGTDASPNPPNLNPASSKDWLAVAGALWTHFFGTDRARTAQPSGYTATTDIDIQPTNGELEFSLAYKALSAASSEDPGAFTLDGAAQGWRAWTLMIPPAEQFIGEPDGFPGQSLMRQILVH